MTSAAAGARRASLFLYLVPTGTWVLVEGREVVREEGVGGLLPEVLSTGRAVDLREGALVIVLVPRIFGIERVLVGIETTVPPVRAMPTP